MDIAGENGAVGAVLDLDSVGADIDRRIAVMALERRIVPADCDWAKARGRNESAEDNDGARRSACPSSDLPLLDFQASAAIEGDAALAEIGLEPPCSERPQGACGR